MKLLYLIIVILLFILLVMNALSCRKYPIAIKVCKEEILLPLHLEIENMEGFSHIELSITAGQMSYITGDHIYPEDFINGIYVDTFDISDDTIRAASKVFVAYKVFNWRDGSFYFIKDTILK